MTPEEIRETYLEEAGEMAADYTLARTLYDSFCPSEEDGVVLSSIGGMNEKRCRLVEEGKVFRAYQDIDTKRRLVRDHRPSFYNVKAFSTC